MCHTSEKMRVNIQYNIPHQQGPTRHNIFHLLFTVQEEGTTGLGADYLDTLHKHQFSLQTCYEAIKTT